MNNEKKGQWLQFFKLILIILCALLYAWGGIEFKPWRRFAAPTLCGIGLYFFSHDWRVLMKVPLLMLASSLGYGAEKFWMKVLKRGYVGLAFGLATGSFHIHNAIRHKEKKEWLIAGFSLVLLSTAYIILGVFNPFSHLPYGARIEETVLGLFVYTMAIMPVQKRS